MSKESDAEPRRPVRPRAGRPRKNPRKSDLPVSEEILRSASQLFARRGVSATTMAQVAEASGLQVASLYYYFRSKNDILERIVGDVNRIPLEVFAAAVAEHEDPATRLYAFIRADAAALCEFPFDINEIHRLAGEDDEALFTRYWEERQQLNDEVESLIASAIERGDFVDVDPHLASLTILANDEAAQNWYRPVGARRLAGRDGTPASDRTPTEVGGFLADMALRALLMDPGRLGPIRAAASKPTRADG